MCKQSNFWFFDNANGANSLRMMKLHQMKRHTGKCKSSATDSP
jgi:hypothetical protein